MIKHIYMQKFRMKQYIKYLNNKSEKVGLDHFNDPKTFMEYSNDTQGVYKNIEEYNRGINVIY